jgi:AcrR family transcriptional regulator
MEAAKRECILVEAAKAFARFGFRKASIDVIAEKAGVGKGTVYLAAESKQDLFYQVLHREVVSWIAEVQKVIDPRVPADQLLMLASVQGRNYLEERPLLRQLLFGDAYKLMPEWGDRLDALVALGGHNAEQILKLGVQQGLFRPDLDVETTAKLLIDLQLAYFVLHDRPGPDREARIERRSAAAFTLILNGLYVRPEKR